MYPGIGRKSIVKEIDILFVPLRRGKFQISKGVYIKYLVGIAKLQEEPELV